MGHLLSRKELPMVLHQIHFSSPPLSFKFTITFYFCLYQTQKFADDTTPSATLNDVGLSSHPAAFFLLVSLNVLMTLMIVILKEKSNFFGSVYDAMLNVYDVFKFDSLVLVKYLTTFCQSSPKHAEFM